MKKILIISDGIVGKNFVQRVIETYSAENIYYIVELKANEYKDINKERFKFFEFDPTSLYKLSNLLKMEFIQVFVVVDHKIDAEHTVKNIRLIKNNLHIILLDKWKLEHIDQNVTLLNSNDILASRLIDNLPNVPVIAQNVGMGEGEIMEVLVPFGSSFVYRHIGVIEQKNWRIVAIYRNRQLVMPSRRRMIQPNDILLLVGDPSVLRLVYRAIKRELGQFPEPFGSNIYLYIDMNIMNEDEIMQISKRAIYIYQHFKHRLIIKIIHPNNIDTLAYLKNLADDSISVIVEFDNKDIRIDFLNDIKLYNIGLVIVDKKMFAKYALREIFYNAKIPILKVSYKDFSTVSEVSLILSDNKDLEKISNTIFDIAEQMSYNIELYNYKNEHQEFRDEAIEHFYNLSTIFSKTIKVNKIDENPLRTLQKKENFMQIIPFTRKITKRRIYSNFSIDSESLYYKLDDYHQLFVPVIL